MNYIEVTDDDYVVGIDPGLKGGISFYNQEFLFAHRTPTKSIPFVKKGKKVKRDVMDLEEACRLLSSMPVRHVFLEQVTAMPGQGVTGMFRFGQNLGHWEGMLCGLSLSYTLVRPQVWKKHHGLIKAEKNASVELARESFPDNATDFKYVTADEGRAEASLIALYGYTTLSS